MPTPISRDALAGRVADGSVVVLEALGADFYSAGHLPGAINLALSAPDAVVRTQVAAAGSPVVVYGSRYGGEAGDMARRIEALCACEVLIYEEGKEDWAEAGLLVEQSPEWEKPPRER